VENPDRDGGGFDNNEIPLWIGGGGGGRIPGGGGGGRCGRSDIVVTKKSTQHAEIAERCSNQRKIERVDC